MAIDLIRHRVLPAFGLTGALVEPLVAGLIHQTYLVQHATDRWVLQRVHPSFKAELLIDLQVVASRLKAQGVLTSQLKSTADGALGLALGPEDGLWRVLSYIEGNSFQTLVSAAQAYSAGVLVARFHEALRGMAHSFAGVYAGLHDTCSHVAVLRSALVTQSRHRLFHEVLALAKCLECAYRYLSPLPQCAAQICHGDLKLTNILFAGPSGPDSERAICLIDLDTVGPGSLAYELGDAWRSWCNRAGEDADVADLDMELLRASFSGYREALARPLSEREVQALIYGPEWVSLELAFRFASDALLESYFAWDATAFPAPGEHNLLRAKGQWSLHCAFVRTRPARAAALQTQRVSFS